MKIGILYPRSKAHPGIMFDFIEGIKAALGHFQKNNTAQLISETIGYGGVEKEVYEKAEKLLIIEGVDVLVAFLDLRILELIKPLFFASGRLILIVNPGANYPENWIPQPNILNLSLQHGFLCWLTGKQAASKNITNSVMASTFYDCGYLHTAAMVKAFVNSGGHISFNYINNQRYDDAFEIKQLTDFLISDKESNGLLCIFDSLPASLFYLCLRNYAEARNLHLFVSPMMLEEKALEPLKAGFDFSIAGYLPWHISLENNANQDFIKSYQQKTNKQPTIFSLLGWESGLILHQVFLSSAENYADGIQIVGNLAGKSINSPRGVLNLDTETNYFTAPVYSCVVSQQSGVLSIEQIEFPEQEWKSFVANSTEGVSSGWTNTYLCY